MSTIAIEAGEHTEDVLKAILGSLTDEQLEDVSVERKYPPAVSIAGEPVTIAALILAGIKATPAVAGAVTAYFNYQAARAKKDPNHDTGASKPVSVTAEGFASEEAKLLQDAAKATSSVSLTLTDTVSD